jgi:indole-3-glycerol phosphate synthase
VDMGSAIALRSRVDDGKTVIAESGVKAPDDLKSLKGFDAVLIGSLFMRAEDIGQAVRSTVSFAAEVTR